MKFLTLSTTGIFNAIRPSLFPPIEGKETTTFLLALEYNVPVEYHLFGHGEHGKALENQLTHMDDADIDLHLNMWVNMADYWMKRMGGK